MPSTSSTTVIHTFYVSNDLPHMYDSQVSLSDCEELLAGARGHAVPETQQDDFEPWPMGQRHHPEDIAARIAQIVRPSTNPQHTVTSITSKPSNRLDCMRYWHIRYVGAKDTSQRNNQQRSPRLFQRSMKQQQRSLTAYILCACY